MTLDELAEAVAELNIADRILLRDLTRNRQNGDRDDTDGLEMLARLLNKVEWDDLYNHDPHTEEWDIEPIIPRGRNVAMYAAGGLGKSYVILNLVIQACLWHGKRFIYFDYEMTMADLLERCRDEFGFEPKELQGIFYSLFPTIAPFDAIDRADQAGGAAAGATVRSVATMWHADGVIIDTLSRAVQGDENDSATVRAFFRNVGGPLKQARISSTRLDHAGKDTAKGQRGSSAKNDDVDLVWRLTRIDGGVRFTAEKKRISWVPDVVDFKLVERDGYTIYERVDHGDTWPKGTKACADALDVLNAPPDIARRPAGKLLRDAGHKFENVVIGKALIFRRKAVDNSPFEWSANSADHFSTDPADHTPDHSRTTGPDLGGPLSGPLADHSRSTGPQLRGTRSGPRNGVPESDSPENPTDLFNNDLF